MADCCICKKRMGMFEGNPLDSTNSNMSSYYVCGTCNSKIRGLKQKNPVLLTTGYNFEKYEITQYKNIISGECVLGTGFISELGASLSDLTGTKSELFSVKLKDAKNHALFNLQKECYMIDANAIIGVDFDYVTFTNNMIGVIASGTAVTVEKLN